jgi:hypothetical protein
MTEDDSTLIARIDERVSMILEALPKLATVERVNAVADKAEHAYAKAASVHTEVTEHVKNHESMAVNRNLILGSYLGGVGAIVAALIALFRKGGAP